MDILFSVIFQILSSLFLCFLLLVTWINLRCRVNYNKKILIDLVFFLSLSKIILYYLMPSILRAFSGMELDINADRDVITIAHIYAIELISWFFWLIPFHIYIYMNKNFKKKPVVEYDIRLKYSRNFLIFLSVGFILTRCQIIFQGEVSSILVPFQSVFSYSGKAAGPLLLLLSLKYYNKNVFVFGFFTTMFGIVSYSTRGALVYSFIFLVYISFFIIKNKKINKIVILSFGVLSLSYFLLGGLAGLSYTISDDGSIELSAGLNSRKINEQSAIEKIEDRFGAPTRIGSAFIDLYESGNSANGMPIINSALAFLPRIINPDKPIPNTLDGDDIYSQGMYLIFREVYGYNTYQMVEFPTGGHFYWQFGYKGIVVLSFISGVYILFSAIFYSRFGFVGIAFLFACFKPWGYMDPKIWVSDIVLQSYQIILPTCFLMLIFYIYNRIFNFRGHF